MAYNLEFYFCFSLEVKDLFFLNYQKSCFYTLKEFCCTALVRKKCFRVDTVK